MSTVLHYTCSSCPSHMSTVRAHVRKSAKTFGFDDETVGHLVLAVDEACTNIIRYAYEGRHTGTIEMEVRTRGNIWEVQLRDYGKKCDPAKLKGRELHTVRPGGLGLFFIHYAFDEVHFDHTPEQGTSLILRKKKPRKKKLKVEG